MESSFCGPKLIIYFLCNLRRCGANLGRVLSDRELVYVGKVLVLKHIQELKKIHHSEVSSEIVLTIIDHLKK